MFYQDILEFKLKQKFVDVLLCYFGIEILPKVIDYESIVLELESFLYLT